MGKAWLCAVSGVGLLKPSFQFFRFAVLISLLLHNFLGFVLCFQVNCFFFFFFFFFWVFSLLICLVVVHFTISLFPLIWIVRCLGVCSLFSGQLFFFFFFGFQFVNLFGCC